MIKHSLLATAFTAYVLAVTSSLGLSRPAFQKFARVETRRESATYIREENTLRVHAKPKVT